MRSNFLARVAEARWSSTTLPIGDGCMNTGECGYACAKKKSAEEAIAAHNRMALAVMAAKEGGLE